MAKPGIGKQKHGNKTEKKRRETDQPNLELTHKYRKKQPQQELINMTTDIEGNNVTKEKGERRTEIKKKKEMREEKGESEERTEYFMEV